jgi:hypothetical protein
MPIPLPNLDDRTFAELTAEARALIPALHPEWTDHNPSDPGIVLVELFAWLTEMLLFQVNEVTPAHTEKFLALLNRPGWTRPEGTSLDATVRQTVLGLRERFRAVTAADYEWLVLHAWPGTPAAAELDGAGRVRRVRCLPRCDLTADPGARGAPAPAHVSVVVVPEPAAEDRRPRPVDELLGKLWAFFDERRTLTTRHHVVGPEYLPVTVAADLALREDAPPQDAIAAARAALEAFFDPLRGGPGGDGWPFGRAVHAAETYAVLDRVALVDYVEDVRLSTPAGADRLDNGADGRVASIRLDANELVDLTATTLVAFDADGRQYQ